MASLTALLHAADQLQTIYKAAHGRAATYTRSISAAEQQKANLLRSPVSASLRDRTLARLQDSIEQALTGVRDELGKMEEAVDRLRELALRVDVFLTSERSQGRQHDSLVQVGAFWEACRAELVDKRETLSDYVCEEISAEEMATRWSGMGAVDVAAADQVDDLMAGFGGLGGSTQAAQRGQEGDDDMMAT